MDGKVSAVVGTQTHVQTADEQIFAGGTAFLCDAGMCWAADQGLDPAGFPTTLPVATGVVQICGVVVEVDESTGRWRFEDSRRQSSPDTRLAQTG